MYAMNNFYFSIVVGNIIRTSQTIVAKGEDTQLEAYIKMDKERVSW